jgi:5-oxoprolinase (ATP-hydrolysing) subunit B
MAPRIARVGDAALLATLGDDLDLDLNAWALRAAADLVRRRPGTPGIGAVVPGHASVLVHLDPDACDEDDARRVIADALARTRAAGAAIPGHHRDIAVRYGGADGPDLAEVAARTGLTEERVVALHAGTEHRVLVLGFVPGFPYLGVLPAELALPRRATPRVRVPAGSVAIAGRQTGIYPFATPGGWHLIGRTDAAIWDPDRDPPVLLAPGDLVRFVPA